MAHQNGTTESSGSLPDSAVSQDKQVDSIVPNESPLATRSDDSARNMGKTKAETRTEGPETRPELQEKASRRDSEVKPYAGKDMAPIRKSVTEECSQGDTRFSGPKRARTTPIKDMQPFRRRTTGFGGLKRKRTGIQNDLSGRNLFEYTFEPVSSDSDSSMSSDDDGGELSKERSASSEEYGVEQKTVAAGGENAPENPDKRGYSNSRFAIGNGFFKTKGRVSRRDGRLKISINETANSGYIAKALGRSIRNHLDIPEEKKAHPESKKKKAELELDEAKSLEDAIYKAAPKPKLNIVIMVIGSRGDIQPFLKIGKILKHQHGHRVRIASHPTFRDFVENEAGLEFFSVGGDPSELMAFMVKNPGLIPSMQTFLEGEISRRRASMAEMFEGFWRACINTTENDHDEANLKNMSDKQPFIADAIIANPPCMAHVHIAERLGIPLHMMFTFPYSPTTQFPHPLANIKVRKSNVDAGYVNFMSYPLVEMLTWQGLGDIVNQFRENTLRLEPVSSLWAPGALYRMKVPTTYLWSPSLVPKPLDWGPEIDIGGFVFMDLATNFTPDNELTEFLDAGDPPIYIGFGSIVLDDPDKFTEMIFKAVEIAGVRALVNKGWGGFGRSNKNTPKNIFMLGNTPHDWLFPKVKAVVHHGGAGTTAIGLKCGKPTMIVPFFGDQPFWGAMIAEARAGAHECIAYKKLTIERLAEGIKQCLTEEAQQNVEKIAQSIMKEGDGAENAVRSFHRSLPLAGRHSMRCAILQDRVAVWQVRKSSLRLSALAAQVLNGEGKLDWKELKLVRHYEWNDFDGPGEPLTGGVAALTDSFYGVGEGFGMVPIRIARHIRKREEHERRKRERQKRREERQRQKGEGVASPIEAKQENLSGENAYADNGRWSSRRQETSLTLASTLSADIPETLPMHVIDDLNWGIKRAGAAILTMPNDFHIAIAQGLHNAPRLYGDATVRKPVRITGVKSGFVAARKELAYGMYDGWTGLVRQPRGDWEDGDTLAAKFAGLGTGLGKGLGGFVIKNTNAVWAPPAFIVKGFFKYIEKRHDGPGSKPFIRRARMIQGELDLRTLEQPQDHEGRERLSEMQQQVENGWDIYSQIWAAARQEFGVVRSNIIGRYRFRKERKQWDLYGAFETIEIANEALHARKNGQNLDEFFAKRKKEMRKAERPRASAMDQRETIEERAEAIASERLEETKVQHPEGEGTGLSQVAEEDVSETTAVATPEVEEDRDTNIGEEKRPIDDIAPHVRPATTVA